MAFFRGQQVVCVNAEPPRAGWYGVQPITKGVVYTVADIEVDETGVGLMLVGMRHEKYLLGGHYSYHGWRFRPVTDISDLKAIVAEQLLGKPRKIEDDQFDKAPAKIGGEQ